MSDYDFHIKTAFNTCYFTMELSYSTKIISELQLYFPEMIKLYGLCLVNFFFLKGLVQGDLFPVQRCCSWQRPADGIDFWQTTHHFKGWMAFIFMKGLASTSLKWVKIFAQIKLPTHLAFHPFFSATPPFLKWIINDRGSDLFHSATLTRWLVP